MAKLNSSLAAIMHLDAGPADISMFVTAAEGTTSFGFGCDAASRKCGAVLNLEAAGAPGSGTLVYTMSVSTMATAGAAASEGGAPTAAAGGAGLGSGSGASIEFPILPGDGGELEVRAMTDVHTLEIFVGGGRGVYSTKMDYSACSASTCAVLGSGPAGAVVNGTAFRLGY